MIIQGDDITSVKCPMCNEMIAGDDSEQLSMNVSEHFIKLHQMSKSANPMPPTDKECEPGVVAPTKKVYREVETFRKDDMKGTSHSVLGKGVNEVTSYKDELTQGEKEIDAVTRLNAEPPGGHSQQAKREIENVTSFRNVNEKCGMGNVMVMCPMCESEVRGMDDGDLSNNLGRHLREAHKI